MRKISAGEYSVKAVKMVRVSWGVILEGNLYYMNQKIGSFEDKSAGAALSVDIDSTDYDNRNTLLQYLEVEHPEYGDVEAIESFLIDLSAEFIDKKKVRSKRKILTYYTLKDEEEEVQRFVKRPYSEEVVGFLISEHGDNLANISNELYDIYPDSTDRIVRIGDE